MGDPGLGVDASGEYAIVDGCGDDPGHGGGMAEEILRRHDCPAGALADGRRGLEVEAVGVVDEAVLVVVLRGQRVCMTLSLLCQCYTLTQLC